MSTLLPGGISAPPRRRCGKLRSPPPRAPRFGWQPGETTLVVPGKGAHHETDHARDRRLTVRTGRNRRGDRPRAGTRRASGRRVGRTRHDADVRRVLRIPGGRSRAAQGRSSTTSPRCWRRSRSRRPTQACPARHCRSKGYAARCCAAPPAIATRGSWSSAPTAGTASAGLIHGSVSTYVLHHAACPVLVVHGDDVPREDEQLAAAAEITG